jgi:membrane protein
MRTKAVLFDIDGTLVDSNDYHVTAWQEAFAAIGMPLSREVIHAQVGKGADMFIPSLLPNADQATAEMLTQVHGDTFKGRYLKQVKPFAGASALLRRVRDSGRRVVLASSASKVEVEHYIDLLGAADLLSASTSGDDVEHTKPAPDVFAAALARIPPLEGHDVLVVGDTPWDIEAAARCGIPAVAVRSGKFPDASLTQAIAIYDGAWQLLERFDSSPLAR